MEYSRIVFKNRFRRRRFARFLGIVDEIIAQKGECRIADVGGAWQHWDAFRDEWGGRNIRVSILNIRSSEFPDPRFDSRVADARDMSDISDNAFDVVYSNSVIEHVGRWPDQKRMAKEVRRIAPRHFVQTPNFWFPIEPHFRMPLMHWLPEPIRLWIVSSWSCGYYKRASTVDEAYAIIEDARLLTASAMAALFPESQIVHEKFGVTKSLMAIR